MSRSANLLGAAALVAIDRVREASGHELSTAAALTALQTMADGGSIDDLRRVLGVSHSGGVRIVRRLQALELVVQERDPSDGRAVRLRLTDAGHREATRVRADRLAALEALLAPLDAGARRQLDAALSLLLGAETRDRASARHLCRLCDPDVCGHPERCPVTLAADAAGSA